MSTQTADAATAPQARRGREFRYESYRIDPASGVLSCRYSLDGRPFGERVTFHPMGQARWDSPAVDAAARLVFLLAGVSYYKTAAPPLIDLGEVAVTDLEREFLRGFYLDGLGEFAYRNQLDLTDLDIEGPRAAPAQATPSQRQPPRPLVPFGGGIDSIVTVDLVRAAHPDTALFVVNWQGDRFAAIEAPAAVAQLPVVRAERTLDPALHPRTAGNSALLQRPSLTAMYRSPASCPPWPS